ncbi:hypothetical protein KTO58_00875 [Chitinophaga pendula]|uniref:hypothetical protein n=1 Tax=Chitinophaga TaxID=79328 RepID=UPI000BAFDE43|nr:MULTISPECIES: hypothetical protein [Chitinophaga]ASZ14590.1 hypothetical protein CK934_28370 [Chitinophaga sp. MD30]UCJ07758.1 hypothetical protein KTO58_00875 [Chitinophaga pendula]
MKVQVLLAGISLLLTSQLSAQTKVSYLTTALRHPESVISDGKYYYVSDIGAAMQPTVKDGDGAIVQLSADGQVLSANIAKTPLDAPKGSAIIKGVLYVADVDKIRAISLASGEALATIDFSTYKTSFLNDVVTKDVHTLFVTASDLGKVFEVQLGATPVIKDLGVTLPMTNGLSYEAHQQRLYINTMGARGDGEIGFISWQAGKAVYSRIGSDSGIFDGLAVVDKNTLVYSDWRSFEKVAGVLKKIDVRSGAVVSVPLPVIAGPADFYYDAKHHRVLLPVMLEGKIQVIDL